jgi:hypothetical protein
MIRDISAARMHRSGLAFVVDVGSSNPLSKDLPTHINSVPSPSKRSEGCRLKSGDYAYQQTTA